MSHRLKQTVLPMLAAGLAVACSGQPDVTDPESTEGEWRFAERAYVGEYGEQVCSERRWEAAGKSTVVERESYDLAAINDVLDGRAPFDGELRAALHADGLTRVESCDDARRFMRRKSDYLEARPTEPLLGPDARTLRPELDESSEDGALSVKIAEGRTWFDPPTVQLIAPGAAVGFCSGVLINAAMLLTAAHCFPADGQYRVVVDYGSAKLDNLGNRICINSGGCNPPAGNNVLVWRYPGYLGGADTERDLAIVFHTKGGWTAPANTSASWLPLLESDAAVRSRLFWNVGYGANDHSGSGAGVGRLSNSQDFIAWSSAKYWLAYVTRGKGRPCFRDSGSASINWDLIGRGLVIGLHVNSERPASEACPDPDKKYRSTKVNDKLGWIVDTVGVCASRFFENGYWYRKCWE